MTLLTQIAQNIVIAPILLPLFAAALLVIIKEKHRKLRNTINVLSCFGNVLIAGILIYWIKDQDATNAFVIYLTSNWDIPFGIALLADRFSALMLLVAGLIALAASIFAMAKWDKVGIHFQTLFQVQLMGINGAFLTADLFNLFVFFEILLTASYGLVLHGSGPRRVQNGLHYIVINLVASFFFLIGIALIYNTAGTLNFADIALYVRSPQAANNARLYIGFAILAIAFLAKAAMWPLNFWLVPAYSSATPPAAAMFSMLTKIGTYVILRLSCLFFASSALDPEQWFGNTWLVYGGLMTLLFGALGTLTTIRPAPLAAYATVISAGTILTVIGFGQASLTSAALYYLPASTLAIAAFFLISELMERDLQIPRIDPRSKETDEDLLVFSSYSVNIDRRPQPTSHKTPKSDEMINLDEREEELVGRAIPAALAFLGVSFACCALLIAGLPPLSSFIAKFGMLNALLNPYGPANSAFVSISWIRWVATTLIIISGFFALFSFSRAGVRYFWSPVNRPIPRLRVIEGLPIVILLAACLLLTTRAEVSLRYTRATSAALYAPIHYISALMSAKPKPAPNNRERLEQELQTQQAIEQLIEQIPAQQLSSVTVQMDNIP